MNAAAEALTIWKLDVAAGRQLSEIFRLVSEVTGERLEDPAAMALRHGAAVAGRAQQRFAPLNSWPDNVNLDKARRLLWPVKQKYGAPGDADTSSRRNRIGPDLRQSGGSKPLPRSAAGGARHPHDVYAHGNGRRGTVALIAGGHSFGKTHGAGPATAVGPEPDATPIEQQSLVWRSGLGSGAGPDAISSGLEVIWTTTPRRWSIDFLHHLFGYEWELTPKPGGRASMGCEGGATRRPPVRLTTDLSLRVDPIYQKICQRFMEHPDRFADAFARAWFKLTHRDMGPRTRYLGPEVPRRSSGRIPFPHSIMT
jgi:catalase-peroxidase